MDDDRLELLRARMEVLRIQAEKLDAEEVSVVATRVAATANPCWATDLPKPFMVQLLNLLTCKPAACAAIRATCSTWSSMHDAWFPGPLRLRSRRSVEIMEGKMKWFPSVKEVDLTRCEDDSSSGVLVELRSMPSLRTLKLPAICAESTVDAEAVCGLTTLTTLQLRDTAEYDNAGNRMQDEPRWMLDLSRLTSTLTTLDLHIGGRWLTDEAAQGLSGLTGLSTLTLNVCSLETEAMHAVSHLTNLTTLNILYCLNVGSEGLCAVSRLTNLTTLNASCSHEMDSEVLRAFHSLTALTSLGLCDCPQLTLERLRTLSSLPALVKLTLVLRHPLNVAEKQALRSALPNVTIVYTSTLRL
jgi:hypothetical protein